MNKNSANSSKYDSGQMLIETFGRGNLHKYLEPKFSERNAFERQVIQRQNNRDRKKILETQQYQDSSHGNQQHNQFEQIDQISHKINGIIKSISISCQKRGLASNSVKKLQKCQTTDRLHQLQNKYSNHSTEKKKTNFQKKQSLKSVEKFQTHKKQLTSSLQKARQLVSENDDFDDINQRIQHINDKIARYQQKMIGYQQTYKSNKKINEEFFKQIPNKQSLIKSIAQDRSRNERRKDKNSYLGKQNVTAKIGFKNKEAILNEKYKEILKASRKPQKEANMKNSNKEIDMKNSRKQHRESVTKGDTPLKKSTDPKIKTNLHIPHQGKLNKQSQFIKLLVQQISLDQDFRQAKHMFGGMELYDENMKNQSEKWTKLQDQLENEGINLSLEQVRNIFMPRDDEIDPFMSVSQSHEQLIYGVIFAYQASQNHWKQNFKHNWSFKQLKNANFTSEFLDRGKKGNISVQDLTFYINTQIDGFYRNRDLLLIFHRLGSKMGGEDKYRLKFKHIMDHLLSV